MAQTKGMLQEAMRQGRAREVGPRGQETAAHWQ